jgi:hypothetical protein
MIIRTESECKAYIDGYNACFDVFVGMLESKKDKDEIIEKMTLLKTAVNNASLIYSQNQKKGEKDGESTL